jgi:hypothetical protein
VTTVFVIVLIALIASVACLGLVTIAAVLVRTPQTAGDDTIRTL